MNGKKEIARYPICGPGKNSEFYKFMKKKNKARAHILAIQLKPDWTPGEKTKEKARKRGEELDDYYPRGSKNAMGAAKISLEIEGFGRTDIRIHGTSNLNSLGKNQSNGCSRMLNKNILALIKSIGGPEKGVGKLVLFIA
jgi:lipoprotein-anchoring transpeptidase ErfK/SrfK